MTERQRTIIKFVSGICPASNLKYTIHFLLSEKDPDAIRTLHRNIEEMKPKSGPASLDNLLTKVSTYTVYPKERPEVIFGTDGPEETDVKISAVAASEAMATFRFKAAEHYYKLSLKNTPGIKEKFYPERAFIHFLLNKWRSSLAMAKKGGDDEIVFLSLLKLKQIDLASEYINSLLYLATVQKTKHVSKFEVLHILFSLIAMNNGAEVLFEKFNPIISQMSGDDYHLISGSIDALARRDFNTLFTNTDSLRLILQNSMYLDQVYLKIIELVHINFISIFVSSYAKISFAKIKKLTGLSEENILLFLKRAIQKGKITGKLDHVSNLYVCESLDHRVSMMEELLDRIILSKTKLQIKEASKIIKLK